METPKKRRSSEGSYPPTALSLPVDPERNFGTFRYERAAHQNVTPLPQRTKGGGKKGALAQRIRIQPVFPQPGKKRRIGAEYAIETDPLRPKRSPISEKARI